MSRITHAEFSMQLSYMASHCASWAGSCLTLPEDHEKPITDYAAERFLTEMRERLERLERWCSEPVEAVSTTP
jgi:hypothetical protein